MGIALLTTPYGPPSAAALVAAVERHKAGDPLRPVTIVVPANSVGVAARRMLARTTTAAGTGIVAATLLTLYRLGELLGAPVLAASGRRPVSTPVVAAAARRVLRTEPGLFRAVADHPSTEEAFVRIHHELSALDEATLARLEEPPVSRRAREVVRIHRAMRTRLAPAWYDERDLLEAARAGIEGGTITLDDLGRVVVHLPQQLSPAGAALITAIADRTDVSVIAALTGVPRADATVRTAVERLGLEVTDAAVAAVTPATGTRVVSTSDADEEVRAAVRGVVDALRAGVPLERMAILSGTAEPYTRLVHDHLRAASIPFNGSDPRALAESVAGRTLLGILDLPTHGFRRDDVVAVLASAPLRFRGRFVPASAWERLTRDAGVVAGPSQWHARLDDLAARYTERAEAIAAANGTEPFADRRVERIRLLQAFVAHLVHELDRSRGLRSWRAWRDWSSALLRDLLPTEHQRAEWPDVERDALGKVEAALDRLAGLDELDDPPDPETFRRTLRLELDSGLGRAGRIGDGILVGTMGLGLGLDLDRVFVLGLAEGSFPARSREDSLLTDDERRRAGGDLPLRGSRPDDDQRGLLAVLAATTGERWMSYPRGDLRKSTERMPSRFLLDTARGLLGGTRIYGDALAELDEPWCTHVPSFAAGIVRTPFPATEQEHNLHSLAQHRAQGGRGTDHELRTHDIAYARAVTLIDARRSNAFTRFDGNLAGLPVPGPARDGLLVSPTRLQTYAACPFDYLMESVLRVGIPENPEELLRISPLDRGSLVHEVLEEFLTEVLAADPNRRPGTPWSDAERARCLAIGEQHCHAYEAAGRTGRDLFWRADRRRIMTDLEELLELDSTRLVDDQLVPVAAELSFGFGDVPPVEIELADGRRVAFRGSADRVDRAADGSLVVIDYKTGKHWRAPDDDLTNRGTALQLPVYAHAARAAFGDPSTPVTASYWFASRAKGEFKWFDVPLTSEVAARFDEVVRTIVDGIEAGVFPCRLDPPSSWSWRQRTYTDPDARGTRDRFREWDTKRAAPEVAGYVALAEPEMLEGVDADG
ncbi:MAG TPA: PD-(D/E)XK nuclease family protein [Acidimicrobiia bacterium]|nr:PD-(D/E)XK nuclease family protein [Acidimicrobiia bacterium]